MKKTYLFITSLMSLCCILVFAGCSMDNSIKSINFLGGSEELVVEVGKFNYEDYKIAVNYSNGDVEQVALTEEMFSAYDKLKFYQIGKHTIEINYKNRSCELKINVQRVNLDDLVSFEDKEVVYNGKPYEINVEGDIPNDVTVYYPNGNARTNAGSYQITAVCYGDNYETKTFTATLKISPAEYDMSKVTLIDAEYTYDTFPKSISIPKDSLPTGVSVEYSINGQNGSNEAVNAGTYTVVASFSSTNANYKQIESLTANLTIKKAKFDDFNVDFNDKNATFTGHEYSIDADLTSVPKLVTTYYSIQRVKNARGENVTNEVTRGNRAIYAGTYIVKINFVVPDVNNYESIAPKTATLTIDRGVYAIENAFMYSAEYTYDGEEKSIILSGEEVGTKPILPVGVGYTYTIRKTMDSSGKEISGSAEVGNSAINAGTYEIRAHFTINDENYREIEDSIGILEIQPAEYSNISIVMYDKEVNYDGSEHSILIEILNGTTLSSTITIEYTIRKIMDSSGKEMSESAEVGNSAKDAGTYEVIATFVDSNPNYSSLESITATLVISVSEVAK